MDFVLEAVLSVEEERARMQGESDELWMVL
jgi:hypothetical protein